MEPFLLSTSTTSVLCGACFLGACGQEVLHWYNLRLELKNDVKFYESTSYWIITVISIIFFGLTSKYLAELVFTNPKEITNAKLFIVAFGYPIIIKQVLKIITKSLDNTNPRSEYAPSSEHMFGSSMQFEIKDYLKNH